MSLRRLAGLALSTAVVAVLLPASPAPAADDSWPVPHDASITISQRGYGHGKGLSQYGAERAAQSGRNYRQIVKFYYPGARWDRAKHKIKVLVTADTSSDVVVDSRSRLKVRAPAAHRSWRLDRTHRRARRWRIEPLGGGRSRIDYKTSSWHHFAKVRGNAEFSAGGRPLRLHLPSGKVQYRGALRATHGHTVNILPIDSYLKGVVPLEVFPSWHAHALRAQAVAARTYAAYERAHRNGYYQICDTTACQVYGGYSAEQPSTSAAVEKTDRRILTKGGAAAFTQFSASNGGWAAAGSFPYLAAHKDPYDKWSGNPYHSTKRVLADDAVEKAWPGVGDLERITVTGRDGHGRWGGRVRTLTLTGDGGSVAVSGDDFRYRMGLRSTWFTVSKVS